MNIEIVKVNNGYLVNFKDEVYIAASLWDIHNVLKQLLEEK